MSDLNNFYEGKTVIITGSSGFIGSHLAKELLIKGAKVNALVRNKSDLWRLKAIAGNIEIVEVDLLHSKRVDNLLGIIKPNYIFHFAIPPNSLLQNESDLRWQINITNAHLSNLFQSIQNQNFKLNSFFHACSGSVYKWDPEHFLLSESTALEPTTLRGKLKLSQRNFCLYLGKTYNTQVKIARIFRAYGPQEVGSKLIVKALEAARTKLPISIGNDEFKRDYIFIDDLINGILMLTLSNLSSGTEMNFGSNLNYSASDIVSRLERILGLNIPKKLNAYPKNSYDQGDIMADFSLAKQQLGWVPNINIDAGLRKTVNWYKNIHQW